MGIRLLGLLLVVSLQATASARNFTTGQTLASKFGVHEIVLLGDDRQGNPFDKHVTVTFTPTLDKNNAQTVHAFYDGGGQWRARLYVHSIGPWIWQSACESDPKLDRQAGAFEAIDSQLPGKLLLHPKNSRQWITQDGRWFLNLSDTAYFLLCERDGNGGLVSDEDFQQYVSDDIARGITSVRCFLASHDQGFRETSEQWESWFFENGDHDRLALKKLQHADRRLSWLCEQHPGLAVQLILFPLEGYGRDNRFWASLAPHQRERIMRHLVARYSAYPQLFWLIVNDMHFGPKFGNNVAMAREVGDYLARHDPWQHPISAGHARRLPFVLGDEPWCSYVHIEHAHDLGALQYAQYHALGKPVFLGEDRYEQDRGPSLDPVSMRYWQRRLFWAWLLSGGSVNYGGRWFVVHPYSQTGTRSTVYHQRPQTTFSTQLTGLDSVRFIRDFFHENRIDLAVYQADHGMVDAGAGLSPAQSPRLMRLGQDQFIVYHPNAANDDDQMARLNDSQAAKMKIDFRFNRGEFEVRWYQAHDGTSQIAPSFTGGDWIEFTAPWVGQDVVLTIRRK